MNQNHSRTPARSLALLLLLVLSLAGCASRPTPLPTSVANPDPATAATVSLYRVRQGGSDGIGNNNVYLDGVKVGRLNGDESFEIKVAPGMREFVVFPEMKGLGLPSKDKFVLSMTVLPQQKYFIRFKTQLFGVSVIGTAVSANTANSLVPVSEQEWSERK